MTALPVTALVTTSLRQAPLGRLRAQAGQLGFGAVRVIKARGRRAGASEALVEELVTSGVGTVVLESLAKLHPVPSKALALLAALRSAGLRVVSLVDGWAGDADPTTLLCVATYLAAVEQKQNSKKGRAAIAVARVNARRVGRPKKEVHVERARVLVEQHGFRKAAAMLGLGATTVRRALMQAA